MEPSQPTQEVTVEDLLEMISRMGQRGLQARCREGSGPLAPIAAALNRLAVQGWGLENPSDDRFGIQALIAHFPSSMTTCDTEARIRFLTRTMNGTKPSQFLGTSIYDWIAPSSREAARAVVENVLKTGQPGAFELQTQNTIEQYWYRCEVNALREATQIIGFTMVNTNITELKRTQLRLERSNRELESFAYVASHDLQEPLRKIQAFSERLKVTSFSSLSPEGRDYIERMQAAATRMRRLINDLLSFSRISSKTRPFVPVDLGVIVREVLDDLEMAIEKAGAQVSVGELPVLEADPSQMRQLLQNLMGNSLKFRREDVPLQLSVRSTVDPTTQRCELMVEDNGIGFEQKYTDRIFNVFQRLHGRGQYEGTGIGLAICRKIAERHGGSIGARSTPGQGSTFTVTLPLKPSTLL